MPDAAFASERRWCYSFSFRGFSRGANAAARDARAQPE